MTRSSGLQVTVTAFAALFSVVGLALYGLPLYYDFMVRDLGWSRTMVTSGNAISKLIVGPLFGFGAGWIVDRFGPRRLMMAGIVMAGGALIGLGATSLAGAFYFFYFFNALGYVCGGPLPCQVLVSRWFDRTRGKVMGIAYLGIGVGGAIVPLLSAWLTARVGWRLSLQMLGGLVVLVALPLAYFVRESPEDEDRRPTAAQAPVRAILATRSFYLLALGRLLMGWLADRVPRKFVMLLIYLLVAAAIPLLLVPAATPGATPMYLFAAIFGLGLGGEYLIIPLMAGELFGIGVLGRVMGIVLTADGVAEATAPMLVGYLRDRSGSYNVGFVSLIAIALVGAAAIALLPTMRTVRAEPSLL